MSPARLDIEPVSLGEIARRLDALQQFVAEALREIRDGFVLRAVHEAERAADQQQIQDLRGDVQRVTQDFEKLRDEKAADRRLILGAVVSTIGLLIANVVFWLVTRK